jgi:hypothetical protein
MCRLRRTFLGELPRSADNLINKPCQINRLGIEFELAGFDLREVKDLVDQAQEVAAGGIHTAQRFQRELCTSIDGKPRFSNSAVMGA